MRPFIIPVLAAFGFAVATPALANTGSSPEHPSVQTRVEIAQQSDRDRARVQRERTGAQTDRTGAQPDRKGAQPDRTGAQRNRTGTQRPRQDRAGVRGQRDRTVRQEHRNRYNWGNYQPGRRPPAWDRNHRNFDARHWQRNYHSDRRYRWGTYNRPQGWYYRRWVFGATLPSLFWGRNYWIDSYWNYGLMDPPYGYVWVRYGGDAILVNVQSGVVLRVVYNIFY